MRMTRTRASSRPSGRAVATASPNPVANSASEPSSPELSSPVRIISTSRITVAEKGEISAGLTPLVPSSHSAAPPATLSATVPQRTQRASELTIRSSYCPALLHQRVGILPHAPVDQPIVAHRLLPRLDPADLLFHGDDFFQIRLRQTIVPGWPELDLVELGQRFLGQFRRAPGGGGDLRDAIRVLWIEHVLRRVDPAGERADVRVALLLQVVGGADDQVVMSERADVLERADHGDWPAYLLLEHRHIV